MVTEPTDPTETTERLDTLGVRLARQADRLISARTPAFGWLAPWQDLLDHLAALPGPTARRFDRVEAGPAGVDFRDVALPALPADGEVARAPARGLPSDILAQLRRVIGRDVTPMQVHDDHGANVLARAHRADAVTVGRDVYFRQGRLQPREPKGFGLLAHEATHVAELLAPGRAWRRLTGPGRAEEERRADANERRATADGVGRVTVAAARPTAPTPAGLAAAFAVIAPPERTAPTPTAAPAADGPAQPALQPMRAASDRSENIAAPAIDVDALRRNLFQDLKRQLRMEFERGA